MPTYHGQITTPRDLHRPFQWVRETDPTTDDPNVVEAGDFWLVVSTATLSRRNDTNDGWDQIVPSAPEAHTHVVADITDFAEGVDDRVSALLVAGSGVSLTYDDVANTLTVDNTAPIDDEAVDDRVASLLTAGSNITLTYDDVAGTLTIAATSSVDDEAIDDRVSALLSGSTGISLSYNDALGTLTILNTGITSNEQIDDRVAALLVAGTNITLTYNDVAGTLTIANTVAPPSNEEIMDLIATMLIAGTGISLTYNDAGDQLTITNTGGGGGGGFSDPTTTKGDLIANNGSAAARLAVGNDGEILIADSAQTSGVKWGSTAAAGDPDLFGRVVRAIGRMQGGSTLISMNTTAAVLTASGTTAVESDSGGYNKYDTSSVSGNAVVIRHGSNDTAQRTARVVQLPDFLVKMGTDASITNVRIWSALYEAASGLSALTDPATVNVAGFRYDPDAGDTTWKACVSNGSASTVVDTGITVNTSTMYSLRVKFVTTTQVKFYIDGVLVATITTNVPSSSTGLGYYISAATTTAAAKSIRFNRLALAQNI